MITAAPGLCLQDFDRQAQVDTDDRIIEVDGVVVRIGEGNCVVDEDGSPLAPSKLNVQELKVTDTGGRSVDVFSCLSSEDAVACPTCIGGARVRLEVHTWHWALGRTLAPIGPRHGRRA